MSPPNNLQTHWHISMQVVRGEAKDLQIIIYLKILSLHKGQIHKLVPPAEEDLLEDVRPMVTCPINTNLLISNLQISTCVAT